ncbi:MAG TPA: LysM peptidoglycan-binding domain-containing protein [Ilumatobacteraceae bacterium]|nr:LysM peptidoglycan-binding domain-containing protein [Ilumatobacteraceae bacterium]
MIRQLAFALAVATPIATIDATSAHAHTPPSATPTASTYTVQTGDALASIARKSGVKLADLLAINHLSISSTIHPGRVLTLPAGSPPAPWNTSQTPTSQVVANTGSTVAYTVKAGDALFLIARRHGVTLAALLAANSFATTSTILTGQVIRIPVVSAVVATPAPTTEPTTTISTRIDTLVRYLRARSASHTSSSPPAPKHSTAPASSSPATAKSA